MSSLWACLLLVVLPGEPQVSLRTVEIQLEGPTQGLELGPEAFPSRIDVELAAGERRRVRVPFVQPLAQESLAAPRLLSATPSPAALDGVRAPGSYEDLPLALRLRSLPPVESRLPRPLPIHVAWLGAALLLVLALRRRPVAAALAGAGAALVLLVLPASPDGRGGATNLVRVLEGDGDSGRWLEVRGALDRLELGADERGWLEHRPADRAAQLRTTAERGALRTEVVAAGATIHLRHERVAPVRPTREGSGGYRFRRVWVREPGAGWEARGVWSGDLPLPSPRSSGGDPPGWLAAGLPQGVTILVGELEAPEGERSWLRLAPF